MFLPPYSPNLNLMERFWKYLCPEIINNPFYRTKDQFRTTVPDLYPSRSGLRVENMKFTGQ